MAAGSVDSTATGTTLATITTAATLATVTIVLVVVLRRVGRQSLPPEDKLRGTHFLGG